MEQGGPHVLSALNPSYVYRQTVRVRITGHGLLVMGRTDVAPTRGDQRPMYSCMRGSERRSEVVLRCGRTSRGAEGYHSDFMMVSTRVG